jgi:hypothetical protein
MDPDIDISKQTIIAVDASGVKSGVNFDPTGSVDGLSLIAEVNMHPDDLQIIVLF